MTSHSRSARPSLRKQGYFAEMVSLRQHAHGSISDSYLELTSNDKIHAVLVTPLCFFSEDYLIQLESRGVTRRDYALLEVILPGLEIIGKLGCRTIFNFIRITSILFLLQPRNRLFKSLKELKKITCPRLQGESILVQLFT